VARILVRDRDSGYGLGLGVDYDSGWLLPANILTTTTTITISSRAPAWQHSYFHNKQINKYLLNTLLNTYYD
jgi:hypothetical protein